MPNAILVDRSKHLDERCENTVKYTHRGSNSDEEYEFYYLQSRYYNPETGRFLNADAFASTGQGLLGNNMFAYCGNNPVNRYDPTGRYMVSVDFLNRAGGFSGLSSSATGGGANTGSQDLSENGIKEPPAFSPGKREPKELRQIAVRSYIEMSSFSDTYPQVKILEGVDDTTGGISTIKNGIALLFMPAPTYVEDLLGVGLCALGVLQTIGGFVKTLVGFKEI